MLWLVYIAGINGYWLFGIAWPNSLPLQVQNGWISCRFSVLQWHAISWTGQCKRSFLFTAFVDPHRCSVGHFGLIWITPSVLRRPKPLHPNGFTVGLILSMTVLSLVHPALSQGHGDLDSVPFVLNLDCSFCGHFLCSISWVQRSCGHVRWIHPPGLVAAISGRSRRGEGEYEIIPVPSGHAVIARKGETYSKLRCTKDWTCLMSAVTEPVVPAKVEY